METSIASHFIGARGGLMMSIIAFCIVFVVIFVLMLLMMALKHFSVELNDYLEFKAGQKGAKEPAAPLAAPTPAVAYSPPPTQAGDEDELVAVLTAAIAASCGPGAVVLGYAPSAERAAFRATPPWRAASIQQNSLGLRG
jgi:hypothetical protein